MPLKNWKCTVCNEIRKTKLDMPTCCDTPMEELLLAPQVKLMEKTDEEHGKSQLKDSQKILKERARRYTTKVELEDIISKVNDKEIIAKSGWVKDDGRVRKDIDDL